MKKPIVCISSTSSLGNTFLDWSIQYLSGQHSYIHVDDFLHASRNILCSNPLISETHDVGNAHGHVKTYTNGSEETRNTIQKIKSFKEDNELACIYPGPMNLVSTAERLYNKKITDDFFKNSINFDKLFGLIVEDYPKIFDVCNQESVPLIYVEDRLWNCSYKPRSKGTWDSNGNTYTASGFSEVILNQMTWGFPGSKQLFSDNIWDNREYIALHLRPRNKTNYNINFKLPHYYVEANSLWTDGEHTLNCIMKWLKLSVNKNRYTKWTGIYKEWQSMQIARLRLPQNIDFICNAIINGWYHDLTQYNLDLFDEAYIQHTLIYKYNLTLKNWGLEKFPDNTNSLTELLEKSFYENLEELY